MFASSAVTVFRRLQWGKWDRKPRACGGGGRERIVGRRGLAVPKPDAYGAVLAGSGGLAGGSAGLGDGGGGTALTVSQSWSVLSMSSFW